MDFGSHNETVPFTASGGITHVIAGGPTFTAGATVPFNVNMNLNDQVHTVKVGANYHF
jgi:hypothetical protein